MKRLAALSLLLLAFGCMQPAQRAAPVGEAQAPTAVIAQTAHPLATKAALDMLARGGNAIDAIVAFQAMLGLVEPQMSGIAGGTLLAVAQGHLTTADAGKVVLEKDTARAELADALRARGQPIDIYGLLSGAGYIKRDGNGWIGAADPRRGGNAAGF